MPFTSAQVAGLVGGQQVMFANQHAYAQSIGYGGGNPAPQLANPYPSPPPSYEVQPLVDPNLGSRIAGGAGMTVPGVVAGGTMAASLLGYKSRLGLLDPFTGISRAFGAGTGAGAVGRAGVMAGREGLGLVHGVRSIGGAFASGGLRAGGAALAGGLTGAAAAFLPYYLAGKAVETVGSGIYRGAQNVVDVGRMATQYMEPQFGRAGAATGGRPGRGQIRQITQFLGDIASRETLHDMRELRRVMDRAGQMGMLEGIGSVTEFKRKFKKILDSTKTVAQVMGSSLEEALPIVRGMQRMGTWSAADVMGVATEARTMGPRGAQAMMGAMQTGAQISYARGGNLREGALAGRQLFGQVTAARQAGVLTEENIRNFTGGVGGSEGRQMVAGALQQVTSGLGQTAMGRLMMAGLGEVREGAFTGRMDPERLRRFQRGELSIRQLQAQGQRRISGNREMAVSFFNRADQMGQSLAAQGGLEGMATGIQRAIEQSGVAEQGENIQNRFIQLLTGANQRQADMIQKMIRELPRIQAERTRRLESALTDSFRQLENRRRGWTGFADAIKGAWERGVDRPLEEAGEQFATSMGETIDRWTEKLTGRMRDMPQVSQREINQMLARGDLAEAPPSLAELGIQRPGQSLLTPSGISGLAMDIRRPGVGMRMARRAVSGVAGAMTAPLEGLSDLAGAAGGLFGGLAETVRGFAGPELRGPDAGGRRDLLMGVAGGLERFGTAMRGMGDISLEGVAGAAGTATRGLFGGLAETVRGFAGPELRGPDAGARRGLLTGVAGGLERFGVGAEAAIQDVAGALGGINLGELTGGLLGPTGEGFTAQGPGGALSRINVTAEEAEQMNARVRALVAGGMRIERGQAGREEIDIGGGYKTTWADAQAEARRTMMRAQGASIEGLLGGETTEKRKAMDTVNAAMRRLMSDPRKYSELKKMREENPEKYASTLMDMAQAEGGRKVRDAVNALTGDEPSVSAMRDVVAISTREIGQQGGDLGPDFKAAAEEVAGVALGSPQEIQQAQNELIDEMVEAAGGGMLGGLWQSVTAVGAAGAAVGAAGGAAAGGIGAIPGAILGGIVGGIGGGLSWMTSEKPTAAMMKEGLLGGEGYRPSDVAAWARAQAAGDAARPEDVEAARRFQQDQGEAAQELRQYIEGMGEEERETFIKGAEGVGTMREYEADIKLGERFQRFAKAAGPVGDIKGVGAEAEERIEAARLSLAEGADWRGGLQQLTRAGVGLTEKELGRLRGGRGGALGQDVALLQDIERMGAMTEAQFEKFKTKKLGALGQELISAHQGTLKGEERQRFERMLEGGLQGAEVTEFKNIMREMAKGAVGLRAGGGGKDPFMEQLTSYTNANREFVTAVGIAMGKEEMQAAGRKMEQSRPGQTKGEGRT